MAIFSTIISIGFSIYQSRRQRKRSDKIRREARREKIAFAAEEKRILEEEKQEEAKAEAEAKAEGLTLEEKKRKRKLGRLSLIETSPSGVLTDTSPVARRTLLGN